MIEPRDHTENRNFIETILRQIPGFRGYLEKEDRRESDALQRDWLADRLQRSKRSIDELTRPLADAGNIDLLPEADRVRGRIDKLIGRIRGAMHGYSGFFDLVRVDKALLDRVYQYDVDLIAQVDTLTAAVEALPENPEQMATALAELLRQSNELERLWDLREDILAGLE
ncbi:MAG: hypothetical protein V3R99_07120 [Thermoguttaceae bacterium]